MSTALSLFIFFYRLTYFTARADPRPSSHDVIIFNGQGQLCHLTCAGEKRSARVSMIYSRKPKKNLENHNKWTRKFQLKSCSIAYLQFFSSNPTIQYKDTQREILRK